jgi:type VII secretion-associated serine protease mycosin
MTGRTLRVSRIVTLLVVVLVGAVCTPSPAYADKTRDNSWQLEFLHIAEAQKISTGTAVIVGLVDTGVAGDQPELSDSLLQGTDAAWGFTGNGQRDDNGHGTGMATLIAGHGKGPGGTAGILGVAPGAKILPVCTVGPLADEGQARAEGVSWAVDKGAKVINLSLGSTRTEVWERALDKALANDVVVVAATGNLKEGSEVEFPARYPGVLAVTGTDREGNIGDFAVTGARTDIAAPGDGIPIPGLHGEYGTGTGTSASTALVSGVVALVRAKFPQLSAAEVIHRIEATADDKGPPGKDDQYGWGIVNPVRALTEDVPPLGASATATPQGKAKSGSPVPKTVLVVGGLVVMVLLAAGAITLVTLTRRTRQ